ncbi:MAG: secondary thiamine-phosphate synthase enzyme YjbQ [Candidatus Hydrothermarchaeales archaeon]
MVYSDEFSVSTTKGTEFIDITGNIEAMVRRSGVEEGVVAIFSRHTTTAIRINENEPRILRDYEEMLDNLVPMGAGYNHDSIDSNAHSHLRSLILGVSEVIPISNGELSIGTWQSIFFVELDGPRRRTVSVKVIGE